MNAKQAIELFNADVVWRPDSFGEKDDFRDERKIDVRKVKHFSNGFPLNKMAIVPETPDSYFPACVFVRSNDVDSISFSLKILLDEIEYLNQLFFLAADLEVKKTSGETKIRIQPGDYLGIGDDFLQRMVLIAVDEFLDLSKLILDTPSEFDIESLPVKKSKNKERKRTKRKKKGSGNVVRLYKNYKLEDGSKFRNGKSKKVIWTCQAWTVRGH